MCLFYHCVFFFFINLYNAIINSAFVTFQHEIYAKGLNELIYNDISGSNSDNSTNTNNDSNDDNSDNYNNGNNNINSTNDNNSKSNDDNNNE